MEAGEGPCPPEAYERLSAERFSQGTLAVYLLGFGSASLAFGILMLVIVFPYGYGWFSSSAGLGLLLHSAGMAGLASRKGRSLLWILAGPSWVVGLAILASLPARCSWCGRDASASRGDCLSCGGPV